MTGNDRRYRVLRLVQRFVAEPPVRLVWRVGLAPPGDAELETTGRRTGEPQRTRICRTAPRLAEGRGARPGRERPG